MSLSPTSVALFAAVLLVPLWLMGRWQRARAANPKGLPLPPGPKPLPIIGNLTHMPTKRVRETYTQWREEHGDIVHVEMLGTHLIFLHNMDDVRELFDKRSSIYSDRSRLPMINELMGWDFNVGFMPYGSYWRRHRKMFHPCFTPTACEAYYSAQVIEIRKFLQRLLDQPEGFLRHVRRASGASILRVIYGIQVTKDEDVYIKLAEDAMTSLAGAAIPGAFFVDALPILKFIPDWFPGAGFKRRAKEWRALCEGFVEKPFEYVKKGMAAGNARPCLVSSLLEQFKDMDEAEDEEVIAKNVTAAAYVGAADTTVSTMQSFFLAMVLYPEIQKKAQAELDQVVGFGNLPDFSHRPYLVYVEAIVKETMRWLPVAPLGVAHMVSVDDEYKGYHIPKGSQILGSHWSVLHDEKMYPDPDKYIPERFIKDGKINPAVMDPDEAAFGFGRRMCPGRFFATNGLFMTMASVLSAFDISNTMDEKGNEVPIEFSCTDGFVSYPTPFRCWIKPRSPKMAKVIAQSVDPLA